jgi:hypothetical protein
MRYLTLTLWAFLLMPALEAQPVPQSIADSFVLITSHLSVFEGFDLLYFGADGTFQEIVSENNYNNSSDAPQTSPPRSGTYTYSIVPDQWGYQGTISITVGSTSTVLISYSDQPYLVEVPLVNVFPRAALTGAVNVSNNSWISATHPTTPGFVIQGNNPRWVLIRGVGPCLSQFGVQTPVQNLSLGLQSSSYPGIFFDFPGVNVPQLSGLATIVPINSWSSDPNLTVGFQTIFSLAGAFQLTSKSSDCAAFVLLAPGAYTIQGTTPSSGGELLTEVYVLPYGN